MIKEEAQVEESTPPEQERPPILRTWIRLYAAVLIHLALWIWIFYLFTVRFEFPQ